MLAFCEVLVDTENSFANALEMLALKRSKNTEVFEPWPSINTGLDSVHVIFCIYEQEACYVINISHIVTVY